MKNMELAASKLAHKETPKKKKSSKKEKITGMHIRKAKGGYIARHESMNPQSEEHILPTMDALHKHIDQHMGEPEGAAEPGGDNPEEEAAEAE